eukprot:gene11015-3721_t
MENKIVEEIKQTCCEEAELLFIKSVGGGDISEAFEYKTSKGSFFVKINSAKHSFQMFTSESIGLSHLEQTSTIRVPKVYKVGKYSENTSFIIMEFINFTSFGDEKKFARKLANLHSYQPKEQKFGFELDNFIGSSPQYNEWSTNWIEFYVKFRLEKQLEMLDSSNVKIKKMGKELIKGIDKLFIGINLKPSLIHGDLWSGNFGFDENKEPVLFDPATYYGHYEAELSIMKMFGGFSNNFFEEYHKIIRKEVGFEKRILLYQLYHYLNHLNLFGSSYKSYCEEILETLLKN